MWHDLAMRTFRIKPGEPGHELHHMWLLNVVEPDGTEITLESYNTMSEAEAAKAALERQDLEDPS
jgi:hypothetical protein